MSRQTTELLPKLEEETGQDWGFRPIGHLHLACSPEGLETVTREELFAANYGIPVMVDDVLAAAWVSDEGRANPADVTQAYAKGARDGRDDP